MKGRSGPVPANIQIYCERVVREVAIAKMEQYLKARPIGAKDWHWCFEQLVRLGRLAQEEKPGVGGHEGNLDDLT